MRLLSIFAALGSLLSVVHAVSEASLITDLPSCALNCILQFIPDTECTSLDISCMCATSQLWTNVTSCVEPSCTVKEALTAQNISAQVCQTQVRDKTTQIKVIGPILCFIATIFVAVRIAARRPWETDLFGWDDGLVLAALICAIPIGIVDIYLGLNGLGKDIWTVPFENITNILRLFYIGEVFYLFATVLTRISILVFYLRVFTTSKFQMSANILIYINVAFCISILFALVFQCSPISYAWTRWSQDGEGKCININAGIWAHAAINMTLDLVVLVLPLPALFGMRSAYPWTKRLRVFIMFSFGLIVTVVSILRLRTLILFADTRNPTWDSTEASLWSVIEATVGIICACLPMAKVFFTRLAPQWLGMTITTSRIVTTNGQSGAKNKWTGTATSGRSSDNNRSTPPLRPVVSTRRGEQERKRSEFVQLVDLESNLGTQTQRPGSNKAT